MNKEENEYNENRVSREGEEIRENASWTMPYAYALLYDATGAS